MAFSDYINNLNIPDLAAAVMGLNAARSRNQGLQSAYAPNQYDAMYQQLANQLQQLTGEMADTNNPQFKARVASRQDEITRQYQQALQQQQALEARRYNRTGMGMINPERRDEALNRSLANYRSQAEAQARAEAMQELVNAATATRGAAPVATVGAQMVRSPQLAARNAADQYDQSKKGAYYALANSVLGPLLKNVDLGKLGQKVGEILGGNTGGISPVPQMANTMYGMGDMSGLDWGASAGGGVPMPPTGGAPSSFNPASFAPTDYNAAPIDFSNWDMNLGFPTTGADPQGYLDPGYGYGAPQTPQFQMPDFNFTPPTFDYGNYNLDFNNLDWGNTIDYGLGTGGWF